MLTCNLVNTRSVMYCELLHHYTLAFVIPCPHADTFVLMFSQYITQQHPL
eukprot:m.16182 g.16182  ORF g.16182 m.16182 type:complete len:50 (+) comp6951_c0_seq1:187-336(+)